MKNKIKKIVTATILSAVGATTIATLSGSEKLACPQHCKAISVYSGTGVSSSKIGKIIETSSPVSYNTFSSANNYNYLSQSADIETNISSIPEITGSFQIYFLSNTPSVMLSSNSSNYSNSMNYRQNFSNQKLNELVTKKAILMVYLNELNQNNVNLSNEDKIQLGEYVKTLKNRSSRTATPYYNQSIDSKINTIDAMINIFESRLASTSSFTQSKLTSLVQTNNNANYEIDANSSNSEIANSILSALNLSQTQTSTEQNNPTTNSQTMSRLNQTRTQEQNRINNSNPNTNLNNQNNPQTTSTENNSRFISRRNNMNNINNTNNINENRIARADRSTNQIRTEDTSISNSLTNNQTTRVPYTDNFHV